MAENSVTSLNQVKYYQAHKIKILLYYYKSPQKQVTIEGNPQSWYLMSCPEMSAMQLQHLFHSVRKIN